jgi:hypothetical protein
MRKAKPKGTKRRRFKDDELEREIQRHFLAWLESKAVDQVDEYVRRGRRFAALETPALKEAYVISFTRWVDTNNAETRQDTDDQEAELRLRNEEPPHALLEEQIDVLVEKAAAATKRLKADPERLAEAEEEWSREFSGFIDSMYDPKRH